MKKIALLILIFGFLFGSVQAQEKKKEKEQVQTKNKVTVTQSGEIKLEDLHVKAQIEKPSVSILPKRVEPDLQKVEFLSRKFDRELKDIPEELFNVQLEKDKVQKIRDIEKLLKKKRK